MLKIYKTIDGLISVTENFEDGVWVNLTNPTQDELETVAVELNVERDFLQAALDEEERPRIENEHGQTLIIVDIPIIDERYGYSTIPLAMIVVKGAIITVCLQDETLVKEFITLKMKGFQTQFKTRFVLQILYRTATRYLSHLKSIDKQSSRIEAKLHKSMKNKELIQMLNLEKSLVFFSTSLKSNETVLERLTRYDYIKRYDEDNELLQDVIIENKQAIEMANIYSSILSGTMDAFASVISNNLNIVMKFLTSVTIVMAIPTMIASFFGMNVDMPFLGGLSFWYIVLASVVISGIVGVILYKKDMF